MTTTVASDTGILNRGPELVGEVSDSVRFRSDAESYITINKGSLSAARKLVMELTFKTLNSDGLLFFMGQEKTASVDRPDYFKLFLKDGLVISYQALSHNIRY